MGNYKTQDKQKCSILLSPPSLSKIKYVTSNWCILSSHKKQFPLYKGIPRACTWIYEHGFWTSKEVRIPFVQFNVASNLSFKYCSDALLGSVFGMLLVSFVLSFSPLICWFYCHSWFRSLTRLIKGQPIFDVISMGNGVVC